MLHTWEGAAAVQLVGVVTFSATWYHNKYKVPLREEATIGEWRKNETKSIQRETNTTTPEIEE